ncbi:MAG TPA: DcaP family trimeric outer membrane transporter [Tahibacter sp.]|uniref:DcaP family trimeric outer membrane transporter n=1 Tax=Tahibacter sp. TaxID=2056211 RepID=UPI002B64A0F4|nr:DcaP family trimeric outer membrane transporter [Tahibacter sp.]HSX60522.1 DcaP family trimeric outer membrane transporter [Tahibacter sp.]
MAFSSLCSLRRTVLSAALLLTLSGAAQADSRSEAALEARIAQLEQQLADLKTAVEAQKKATAAAPAAAPAGPAAPGVKAPIQVTTLTPGANPGTTVKIGGFMKTDFMLTRTDSGQLADSASGRDLYVPGQTPVGGSGSSTDYDAGAKFSRVNIGIDTVTENNDKLGAFVEFDFFGGALGNENATNTYGVTLRHAYAYWNKWLAGQTWSTFMDTAALPDAVDFIGPTDGVIFVRQPQVRYTTGNFQIALEDPQTTIIPRGGGATASSDRGALPDLAARYTWKGTWGHFGVGGLLRDLRVDRPAAGTTPAIEDSQFGGALTLGGKWNLGEKNDIRYQLTGGSISRYIGLGVTADSVLDSNNDLEAIDGWAGYVAWRHIFTKQLRSNVMYARSEYDNPVAYTGQGVTKSSQSFRVNLIYSPLPKLDVGVEYMVGRRELESGAEGDIDRLQFMAKYSF